MPPQHVNISFSTCTHIHGRINTCFLSDREFLYSVFEMRSRVQLICRISIPHASVRQPLQSKQRYHRRPVIWRWANPVQPRVPRSLNARVVSRSTLSVLRLSIGREAAIAIHAALSLPSSCWRSTNPVRSRTSRSNLAEVVVPPVRSPPLNRA
jgi:hypothetical protein